MPNGKKKARRASFNNPYTKRQGEIYLKQQAEEQNMSDYPAGIQGTDRVSVSMQNMYDAEQKRNALREGVLGPIYNAADKARDRVVSVVNNASGIVTKVVDTTKEKIDNATKRKQ